MTAQLPATIPAPLDGSLQAFDPWSCLYDAAVFKQLETVAKAIQNSALLPPHLRGKVDDITLALAMARAMRENPIIVLQSIFVISGRAGWSAQYVIARANQSGKFRGPLNWTEQGKGADLAVTCYATMSETDERVESTVSMQMARADGWTRNPKYNTMPELMLRYRSATRLVRLYVPEVLMGLAERYEILDGDRDVEPVEYVVESPSASSSHPPRPGEGRAALPPRGQALQAAASEADGPSLALPPSVSPPEVRGSAAAGSATPSTAVPSGEDAGEPRADEAGSTPRARATSPSSPAPEALQAPDTTPVGAAEASGQGAAAPATGGRITRAKLARLQAEQLRKRETDEQRAERQKTHHASWKDGYKSFAKDLAALQIPEADIDTVSAWCDYRAEQSGKRILRPSHRSPETRRELLGLLQSEKGQAAFLRWADELVDVPEAQPAQQTPQVFTSPEVAIAWGMDKGVFESIEQAREAYAMVKREGQPANAEEMAAMWVVEVQARAAVRTRTQGGGR
jgi:hypothetical protein